MIAGGDVTLTITPDKTAEMWYKADYALVDGKDIGPVGTSYTFKNVQDDHRIYVAFKELEYVLTFHNKTGGGKIGPYPDRIVVSGASDYTTYFTPYYGYNLYDVKVDGVSVTPTSPMTFTDRVDHTVEVEFRQIYTVTASVADGGGGSISPGGNRTVFLGGSITYTAAPDTGYALDGLFIDGTYHGGISSYTFGNVTTNHSIIASFDPLITASAGSNGIISPGGAVPVDRGTSQTFSILPNAGYRVADVQVDGVSVGSLTSYTFADVTIPHIIQATFTPIMHRIDVDQSAGGIISPDDMEVAEGTDQTFTITPDVGYRIREVSVDKGGIGPVTSYTFTNVTNPHKISAMFEPIDYTITVPAMVGGEITAPAKAQYGMSVTLGVRITDLDYRLKEGSIKVNGIPITHNVFDMPAENVTITAEIEKFAFKINVVPSANGSVVAPPKSVPAGHSVNLDVRPDAGYALVAGSLKADGVAITGTSFTMPAHDVTVTAAFERPMADPLGGEIQRFEVPPEETPGGEAEGFEAPPDEETPGGEAEDFEAPPDEETPGGEAEGFEAPDEEA